MPLRALVELLERHPDLLFGAQIKREAHLFEHVGDEMRVRTSALHIGHTNKQICKLAKQVFDSEHKGDSLMRVLDTPDHCTHISGAQTPGTLTLPRPLLQRRRITTGPHKGGVGNPASPLTAASRYEHASSESIRLQKLCNLHEAAGEALTWQLAYKGPLPHELGMAEVDMQQIYHPPMKTCRGEGEALRAWQSRAVRALVYLLKYADSALFPTSVVSACSAWRCERKAACSALGAALRPKSQQSQASRTPLMAE
eukprot:786836-Pleurochrysis_carterae.AAC.4